MGRLNDVQRCLCADQHTIAELFRLCLSGQELNELKGEIERRSWSSTRDDPSINHDATHLEVSATRGKVLLKTGVTGRITAVKHSSFGKNTRRRTDRGSHARP